MASILTQLQTGLSIWREEIDEAAASIPVIGRLFARQWRILHIEPGALRYIDAQGTECTIPDSQPVDDARDALKGSVPAGPLVVRFAASQGFRRATHFPVAAGPHLVEAARLALPRLSPLAANDTAFAIERREQNPDEPRIDVTIAIVRQANIDAALVRAQALGLTPAAVDLADGDGLSPPVYDLRPGQRPPGTGRSAFRFGVILVAIFLVIGAGFAIDARMRLSPSLSELETPAQIEASLQAAVVQAQAKSNASSATLALADLSRRLPDGAYLTSFAFEDGEVRVSGLAWDAAAALRALDSAPEFNGATFSDATVRDENSGRQRFEIVSQHRASPEDGS